MRSIQGHGGAADVNPHFFALLEIPSEWKTHIYHAGAPTKQTEHKEAFTSSCKIMLTSSREVQRDARLGLEVPQQETLDQTLVEVKVEELYRCAFETMRKELVQHDERLEKE